MGFPGAEKMVEQLEKKNFAKKRVGLTATKAGRAPRCRVFCRKSSRNPELDLTFTAHMPIVDPTNKAAAGFVTSGCPSPTFGKNIAMGYVDQSLSKIGTILAVESGSSKLNEVELVKMPFVKSKYYLK